MPMLQSNSIKRTFKTQTIIRLLQLYNSWGSKPYFILYLFRYLILIVIVTTMVQCLEFPSNKNISDSICINSHNDNTQPPPLQWNQCYFENLPNNKLSRSVFRATTFFQYSSMKSSLNILLQHAQNLEENIQTLYTKLITNHDDQKT